MLATSSERSVERIARPFVTPPVRDRRPTTAGWLRARRGRRRVPPGHRTATRRGMPRDGGCSTGLMMRCSSLSARRVPDQDGPSSANTRSIRTRSASSVEHVSMRDRICGSGKVGDIASERRIDSSSCCCNTARRVSNDRSLGKRTFVHWAGPAHAAIEPRCDVPRICLRCLLVTVVASPEWGARRARAGS